MVENPGGDRIVAGESDFCVVVIERSCGLDDAPDEKGPCPLAWTRYKYLLGGKIRLATKR